MVTSPTQHCPDHEHMPQESPLTDEELADGGLVKQTAWVRMSTSPSAKKARNDSFRKNQEGKGLKQISVTVPIPLIEEFKVLAKAACERGILAADTNTAESQEDKQHQIETLINQQTKLQDAINQVELLRSQQAEHASLETESLKSKIRMLEGQLTECEENQRAEEDVEENADGWNFSEVGYWIFERAIISIAVCWVYKHWIVS